MTDGRFILSERTKKVRAIAPFSYRENVSIGTGGIAPVAFYPRKISELCSVIDDCTRQGVEYVLLGNATNVLPPDGESSAIVVFTTYLSSVWVGEKVFALAGATTETLLNACEKAGKTGAEFLEGIPATVGGSAYMNAGASGRRFADILEKLLVYDGKKIRVLNKDECEYDYKSSLFMKGGYAILGATFLLQPSTQEEVRARRLLQRQMREKLPKGKSMGCVFKNPPTGTAGKYIEGAGLKGLRIGGARVSNEHANFIINEDGATSAEIKRLIELIRNAVYAQYGVKLEEEIRYLP